MRSLAANDWGLVITLPVPEPLKLAAVILGCNEPHQRISAPSHTQAWRFAIQVSYTHLVAVSPVVIAEASVSRRPVRSCDFGAGHTV